MFFNKVFCVLHTTNLPALYMKCRCKSIKLVGSRACYSYARIFIIDNTRLHNLMHLNAAYNHKGHKGP
jgi:hypothetical protein